MENEHNKYNEAELIVFGGICFSFDAVCFLIDWTGVGALFTPVIQSAVIFGLNMLAQTKGDKNALKMGRQVTKYAVQAVPWLPTLTATFIIETYIHNHPKALATVAKVGGAVAGAAAAGPAGAAVTTAARIKAAAKGWQAASRAVESPTGAGAATEPEPEESYRLAA